MRPPALGGGRGRAHAQILASVAANLGQHAVGHCVPMSAYILPQLQHGDQEGDFTITEAQGSWFGRLVDIQHLAAFLVPGLTSIDILILKVMNVYRFI